MQSMKKILCTAALALVFLLSNMVLAATNAPPKKKKQGAARTTQTVVSTPEMTTVSQQPATTFVMIEAKAYELFRNGYYDEAATYFSRMADERASTLSETMKYDGVDNIVKQYVDAQLLKFLMKGEFEKTTSYVERVSEANRNKKIQALANTIFEELKQREKKVINIRDFRLSRYFADEEAFQLTSSYGSYIVDVELANARSFKSGFYRMEVKDLDFTPDSGRLKLSYFTLVNPDNNRRYPFVSGLPVAYNSTTIEQFYTSRMGAGVPRVTHGTIDSIRGMRSIKPLDAGTNSTPQQPAASKRSSGWNTGLSSASTPAAKVKEEELEIRLEN